jgi:hypothetical protein
MDITTESRLRRAARFATYDDEATGLGRVAPDRSRWATPADLRAFRRSVVLADRYRRAIARGRGTVT